MDRSRILRVIVCLGVGICVWMVFGEAKLIASDLTGQLRQAEDLLAAGQYRQAELIYKGILGQTVDKAIRLGAQKGLVLVYIGLGDSQQAQASYERMLDEYKDQGGLAEAVYQVGYRYRHAKEFGKARDIYRYLLSNKGWHGSRWAIHAQRDLIHMAIETGDEKGATEQVDRLLVDFADHNEISGTIYNLGKYYIKAGRVR